MSKLTKALAVLTVAVVAACSLTACGGPKMTGYLLDGQRELAEGETTTLTVTADYGDKVVEDDKKATITTEELSWTSSDEAIATVENGVVTALASGDVTISASSEDEKLTGSMDIHVVAVKEITATVDKTELALTEKETTKLTVTAVPERDDYTISWTSSDDKVAAVDEEGTVTAVGAGEAEITVTVSKDDVKATVTVAVTVKAEVKPTAAPTAKPTKNNTPSQPAKNDKPAEKPAAPAQPNAPAPAPEKPAEPAPAPTPEPTIPPNFEPVVSLPIWGDNMNGVPFD